MHEETQSMLLELAALLDDLTPDRFDYSEWVGEDWQGDPDLSCGTVACAAGHATTLPSYRARGLTLQRYGGPVVKVEGRTLNGTRAMAHVLGIADDDAAYLFMPSYYDANRHCSPPPNATAPEVAEHIRDWLNRQP